MRGLRRNPSRPFEEGVRGRRVHSRPKKEKKVWYNSRPNWPSPSNNAVVSVFVLMSGRDWMKSRKHVVVSSSNTAVVLPLCRCLLVIGWSIVSTLWSALLITQLYYQLGSSCCCLVVIGWCLVSILCFLGPQFCNVNVFVNFNLV